MRFFSNEGKNDEESSSVDVHTRDDQTRDDQTRDESADDPGTVSSEPVAVPQQRAGSPWSEGPTGYAGDHRTQAGSGDDASGSATTYEPDGSVTTVEEGPVGENTTLDTVEPMERTDDGQTAQTGTATTGAAEAV